MLIFKVLKRMDKMRKLLLMAMVCFVGIVSANDLGNKGNKFFEVGGKFQTGKIGIGGGASFGQGMYLLENFQIQHAISVVFGKEYEKDRGIGDPMVGRKITSIDNIISIGGKHILFDCGAIVDIFSKGDFNDDDVEQYYEDNNIPRYNIVSTGASAGIKIVFYPKTIGSRFSVSSGCRFINSSASWYFGISGGGILKRS